ncbi:NAD-dependent protein deacetylase [Pyrolobus fumarii]|uniref:NAD-dependent protein deacetylase n=1 Tax=Pyrolobus fumarii TaxID=54252 RepID=UPI00068EBB63|nr:NAD-dependent protein deacetylase [Pyrolobus fumarii]
MTLTSDVERAARLIAKRGHVAVLTGAGISADSGIPTFRGKDGLWRRFRAEELATPEAFRRNPRLVWEWYRWRMEIIARAQPNEGHYALVELEKLGLVDCLITQNVDGLHQRAGSKNVIELHGNIWRARCTKCSYTIVWDEPPPLESLPPRCPRCNNLLRPDVVWFGEPIPEDAWNNALKCAMSARVMLVIGTSGVVYPAALLPYIARERGAVVIEINVERSALTDDVTDIFLRGRASEVLPQLVRHVKNMLSAN